MLDYSVTLTLNDSNKYTVCSSITPSSSVYHWLAVLYIHISPNTNGHALMYATLQTVRLEGSFSIHWSHLHWSWYTSMKGISWFIGCLCSSLCPPGNVSLFILCSPVLHVSNLGWCVEGWRGGAAVQMDAWVYVVMYRRWAGKSSQLARKRRRRWRVRH